MHRSQLGVVGVRHEEIQRLRLADERTTRSRHIDQNLLWELPRRLVPRLNLLRNLRNALDGTIPCNHCLLQIIIPQTQRHQLLRQMLVDHCELSRQNTPCVHVRREGLEALIVAENLGCGRRRHGRDQQRVAHTLRGPDTKRLPVKRFRRQRSDAPQIGL